MAFFVLSGYVIGFVADTKEKTFRDYSIARLSRLYSIVIPALIITLVCDLWGVYRESALYYQSAWPVPNLDVSSFVLSFLMVQSVWGGDAVPGTNVPFWSLSFELMFYLVFACLFYFNGTKRWLLAGLAALIAGPDIVTYFPIWLMGYGVYHLHQRPFISRYPAYFWTSLSLAVLVVLVNLPRILNQTVWLDLPWMIAPKDILADYIYALLFAVHILYVPYLLTPINSALVFLRKPIVFFSSITFSLYLFHRPLIQFFATFYEDKGSISSRTLVLGGTFLVIMLLGLYCERQKRPIKTWLNHIIPAAK
jgi:peptidoglycan/LPS O-acetylase OafA/YrhL